MFRNRMEMKLGRQRHVFEPRKERKLDWSGAIDAWAVYTAPALRRSHAYETWRVDANPWFSRLHDQA
jgi:hypothetical protein